VLHNAFRRAEPHRLLSGEHAELGRGEP